MAETDIFNPLDWTGAGLDFNPNPSYGFSRRAGANRQIQRPRLGPFISREVGNAGHAFPLTWVGTSLSTAQRVTRFFHDFKHGYFTFINVDWGGRHFVGRFTSEPEAVETANGKWTVQNATFEEVPTARMLQYPGDWSNDGHTLNVLDDFLNPLVALMLGAWVLQIAPTAPAGSLATQPSAFEAYSANGFGSWGQMQYVGWGFQMTFRLDPSLGVVNIYLDGVLVVTDLDLSTAAGIAPVLAGVATIAYNTAAGASVPNSVTVTALTVPLDMHRVKVYGNGPGANGANNGVIFPQLVYLY